jgi:glycosyltransferase involved in cell wall biosynthesis
MALFQGVPVLVASERCADEWKGTLECTLDRVLAPRTDAIVVNSQAVLNFYAAQGIEPSKLVLIRNGIVPDPPAVADRAAVLREFDVPPDAQVLGFVGRLWPQKRVRDVIWATEIVRNVKPKLFLLVIGDGPEREALLDYTKKIALLYRVRFLGHREDIPRLLSTMDIFVMPSQFEGMPNAVMEAMNAGVAVVASDIPANSELVIDGETGLLYPVGDTKALSIRVNRLLDDHSLRTRLGQAGQQRVREQFNVENMVAGHIRLYRKLAEKKRLSIH